MLELMKLECKKYLSVWEYSFVIGLILLGIAGSILLSKEGAFTTGDELFTYVLRNMGKTTELTVWIGGGVAVALFGTEIRNSYVLPQGRRNILLSKAYIVLLAIVAVEMSGEIFKIVIFNEYEPWQGLVVVSIIIANLILVISLTSVVITLALVFKSKIVNQGSSIVAAGITYLIVYYGLQKIVAAITASETIISSLVQYLVIILVIAIISAVAYKMAFGREITKDL